MKSIQALIIIFVISFGVSASEPLLPIIDMHLHSYDKDSYYQAPTLNGNIRPATAESHFDKTYDILRRNNIVIGVVSGTESSEENWISKDKDKRLLRGLGFYKGRDQWTPDKFEALVKSGKIDVFGEIGAYYSGTTLADPYYAPYLKICEQYGIPVAIHTGGGPRDINYRGAPNARLVLANPLLIEDVLVKYPKLKIYLMHAGEFYYKEALRLMLSHSQVYADLGVVLWVHPLPKHYGRKFVLLAKEFGLLDRVMFGSDQMVWPDAIEMSLKQLDSFDFLSKKEKRGILYDNAARFLNLSQKTIDKHHGIK